MSASGTVKFFNYTKGYGFITPTEGGEDLFVHFSNVNGNPLQEGDQVQFDSVWDETKGKSRAENVSGGTGTADMLQKGKGKGKGFGGGFGGGYGGGFGGGYGGQQGGFDQGFGGQQGGFQQGGFQQGGGYGGPQGGFGGQQGGYGGY